jgi:hypothetical protein
MESIATQVVTCICEFGDAFVDFDKSLYLDDGL